MENQDTKTMESSTWSKQSEDDQKEGRCRKGDGKDFRNMSNERVKIQPAVKKETEKVAAGTDMLPSYRTMKYKSPIWGYFHVQKKQNKSNSKGKNS